MKKIISLLLTILILVTSVPYYFAQEMAEEVYLPMESELEAVEVLKGFGVIDKNFKADSVLTRAEFTMLLIRTMEEEIPAAVEFPFADVTSDMESFNAIASAYGLGLISKADLFNPDAPILTEHAYKMLVVALGYNLLADQKWGYSAGYANIASSISLEKGSNAEYGKGLYGSTAARLVLNMLKAPVFVQTVYGKEPRFEIDKGSVYMSKALDIYEAKGIVTANGLTDLDGFSVNEGFVKIDGVKYNVGTSNAGLYLGQNINFYYKKAYDDNFATVLYASPDKNNNEVTVIEAKSLDGGATTAKKVVYFDEDDRRKEANLAGDVSVVYNGGELFGYNKEHLLPAVGNVTLIDNDFDDTVDVVLVRNYRLAVVHMADAETDTIYMKFGAAHVELEKFDGYMLSKNGQVCDLTEAAEWDVACVAENGSIAEIMLSSASVSGTISELVAENGKPTEIRIEDGWYEISNGYIEKSAEIALGVSGVFYLGADGRVVAGKLATTARPNYAILLDAKDGINGGLDENVLVQLFTQDNEIVVMSAAERVSLNGVTVQRGKLIDGLWAAGAKNELVTINADTEGKLTEINTPKDLTSLVGHVGYDEDHFSLDRCFKSVRFSGLFGGCWKTKDTLFFSVPTDKDAHDLYRCENAEAKLGSTDVTYKNIKVYDLDRFNNAAVILNYDFDNEISADVPGVTLWNEFFIISDIKTALDNDGTARKKVCGYFEGKYVEYFIADGGAKNVDEMWKPDQGRIDNPLPNRRTKWGFIGWTDADFKIGDVIQPELDAKGELKFFRMLYSAKLDGVSVSFDETGHYGGDALVYYAPGELYEINELAPSSHHKDDPGYISMCYTALGRVTDIDTGGSKFRFDTALAMEQSGSIVKYNVNRVMQNIRYFYIYNPKKQTVTQATAADLKIGEKIFVHHRGYVVMIKE